MRKALETLVVFLALLILGYFYLAPNSGLALLGDTTHLISEGGDASTAPFQYHVVLETARRYPTRLLFGTLFTPQLNAPYGLGLWVPMFERLSVVLLSPFFTLEGLATAFVWMSMTMNGLVLYWLGRRRGWPFAIALALGICWAFNPYTRARSISHFALVGIFYLPSAFLGLDLLRNAKRKRE